MKKIKLIVCLYAFFVTAIQAQQWETIPGQGRDIGVGYNGMVWHLGWASVPGGHPIYRRMGSDWERMDVGSGAVRLDVDAFGNAWCVNSNGLISRWDGSKWQSIGASLRKEEQQLWHEFRDVCDAVFAKRQQQSAEFKAELDANLALAKNLIAELEGLTELTAQALTDARKRVDEIRQEFGGLGQFPKAQVNEIKAAFNQAAEVFEQKLKDERIALKQQIWVNLFEANKLVNAHELALVKGKLPDLADQAELEAQIDTITQWPSGGLKAIQQKLARANGSADVTENLNALRELCIRADILTDSATPVSEQALRTAFQVNQLQQNFGRKTQDATSEFENLVFEWIAVGAVDAKDYEPLFARFNACRLKAAN